MILGGGALLVNGTRGRHFAASSPVLPWHIVENSGIFVMASDPTSSSPVARDMPANGEHDWWARFQGGMRPQADRLFCRSRRSCGITAVN
jgi:hypothetical protein